MTREWEAICVFGTSATAKIIRHETGVSRLLCVKRSHWQCVALTRYFRISYPVFITAAWMVYHMVVRHRWSPHTLHIQRCLPCTHYELREPFHVLVFHLYLR